MFPDNPLHNPHQRILGIAFHRQAGIIRVRGLEHQLAAFSAQGLDREFAFQIHHHHVAGLGAAGTFDNGDVAGHHTDPDHTVALHADQERAQGFVDEELVDGEAVVRLLLGGAGEAGTDRLVKGDAGEIPAWEKLVVAALQHSQMDQVVDEVIGRAFGLVAEQVPQAVVMGQAAVLAVVGTQFGDLGLKEHRLGFRF